MDHPDPMASGAARRPTLIVVSGRPGSGKSTLARKLAAALPCPLVSRDEINEGILRTFANDPELSAEDRVAKAAFDAFFRALDLLVSADVTCVAEAAFQDFRWRIGLEPLLSKAAIRVVHCELDAAFAQERVVRRRLERQPGWSPGHASTIRPFEPLSLPVPSIRVATTDGYDPPLDAVVAFVTAR